MRRKIGKLLRKKQGFTLIESVLGVLLFALVMTVVSALFVTSSRITVRTQQSENAVNRVIALSEEAGADLSAPYETRDFSLAVGGTVNEELRLVTYEVPNGDGTVRLSKFVYAPAETGGTP